MKYPEIQRVTNKIYEIGGMLVYLPESVWSLRDAHLDKYSMIKSYCEKAYHDFVLNKVGKRKTVRQKLIEAYNKKVKART